MKQYTPRLVDELIERKLSSMGAILLRGPRAVGKTTTALHHSKSAIRLDISPSMIQAAELAPTTVLEGEAPRLIDEWQLAPSIWNAIRAEVDARGQPGQFILAGSSAPSEDHIRHTGAGRIARLTLRPMSLCEQGVSTEQIHFADLFTRGGVHSGLGGPIVEQYADLIVKGGWPGLQKYDALNAADALRDYVDNISDVDLRTLDGRPDPIRTAALIAALARNISTEAALSKLAAETDIGNGGVSMPTVRKYLDQLTRIFVLEELPAWRPHIRSSIRVRVKPKWHFIDPSLATAALGVLPEQLMDDLEAMGLLFESMVIRDLRIYADMVDARVSHYRDSTGLEVDAIVEKRNGDWIAFEVKLGGERAIEDAVGSLEKLHARLSEKKLARLVALCVVTAGQTSYTRRDGVHVISLGHLTARRR